jgi:hypothetical protein
MKKGDILVFIDEDPNLEYNFDGAFTIGDQYVIKEFGEMHNNKKEYFSWIVIEDDLGRDWEICPSSFITLDDFRNDKLNILGI